jgi:hypothetical protein
MAIFVCHLEFITHIHIRGIRATMFDGWVIPFTHHSSHILAEEPIRGRAF